MITSLIFRFRDFTIEPGETVAQHTKIAEEKDDCYVYWGWWAKSHEAVPEIFLRHTVSKNLPIYLFDSGQQKLFQTNLLGHTCDIKGTTVPDSHKSPPYYNNKKCKMWLKLGPITEVIRPEEELLKYAYLNNNNNLFSEDDDDTLFSDFYDKQVSNLKELLHQERTIWFLQDYEQSKHESYSIILTNVGDVHPCAYAKSYKPLKGNKILWLSDIHFDTQSNHHYFQDSRIESKRAIKQ